MPIVVLICCLVHDLFIARGLNRLEYSVLMEVNRLNVMLMIKSMIQLMMSLMIRVICDYWIVLLTVLVVHLFLLNLRLGLLGLLLLLLLLF